MHKNATKGLRNRKTPKKCLKLEKTPKYSKTQKNQKHPKSGIALNTADYLSSQRRWSIVRPTRDHERSRRSRTHLPWNRTVFDIPTQSVVVWSNRPPKRNAAPMVVVAVISTIIDNAIPGRSPPEQILPNFSQKSNFKKKSFFSIIVWVLSWVSIFFYRLHMD